MASSSCAKCKQLCHKPLQLPECGHVFCKRCLSDYFSTLSSWTDEPDYFSCPECGSKVSKPDLPIAKWTKAFKMCNRTTFWTQDSDELRKQEGIETGSDFVQSFTSPNSTNTSRKAKGSTFYSNDSHEQTKQAKLSKVKGSKFYTNGSHEQSKQEETDTGSDFVKFRKTSSGMSRSLHRTAIRLSKEPFEKGFESKISSDERDCLYFGGDIMPNGDLILCDWLNFSVKLFEPSGQFICKIRLDEAPLDVTAVRDDMIIVSFGSRSTIVLFLAYMASRKDLNILGCNKLPGFLYSTTMHDGNCLGIFERDGSKQASVVQVAIDRKGVKSGSARRTVTDFITPHKNIELSSESGIFYDHTGGRLYVTSRRKLLCFRKDRRLIFRESFEKTAAEMYILGSVTCDKKGVVYIASDQCVLRVTKDGDLISVVHSPAEPYHILVTKDQLKLALIGKQSEVMYNSIEKGT
ncbi:uncharacterized protein LOC123556671 [Mercenaria mercenaria]|uniref:uncharacterized protein LOC123556671 n=1 Tax=Mercenaria mercenaria TaxID=6596 RepID=UPI00234FA2ED|nr:uncharacterized protein LOC123556671 [Mercenaria mercenaria]XP_045203513.2 uncharacterized protein LOC123556671 [Mercenaria mercenaria]